MRKAKTLVQLLTVWCLLLLGFKQSSNAQCRLLDETFNVNPLLSSTNVDGSWYPDRYQPSAFTSDAGRLKISISASDGAQLRPSAYSGPFYNTQGRKFNQCGSCVTVVKADLYIPSDWATNKRRSDIWATAFNASNAISAYPILGFRNVDGATPGIYCYNISTGAWINSGVVVSYDAWYSLQIRLAGSNLEYLVNNVVVASLPALGSTYFGNIIMQAYNFNDNSLGISYDPGPNNSYDAYWDNLITTGTGGKVVANITQNLKYCTIQAAIDAASTDDVIAVYPGNYYETASNRYVFVTNGPHQFGLFIDKKLTIKGVKSDGTDVNSVAEIGAKISTNATNNFGYSGIFVQADGVTLQGLEIGDNIINNVVSNNKTIEVVGDVFTMNKCKVNTALDEGAVYLGRWDAAHPVNSYSFTNNAFNNTLLSVNNGVGLSGSRSNRVISNNLFTGVATPYIIGFRGWNGASPAQGWIVNPVGGAVITGNTFNNTNVDKYFVARGNAGGYINSELNWSEIWNSNNYGNHVVALSDFGTFTVRSYNDGTYPETRCISPAITENINRTQTGDVVLVGAGTYPETLTIDKSITLLGPNATISPNVDGNASMVNSSRIAEAIINPVTSSGAMIISNANDLNVAIKGFTIDRGNGTANSARFMDLINRTDNVWIFENNIFQNAPSTINGYFYLTGTTTGMNFTFNQNRFTNNGVSNGIAFWGSNPTQVTITNNVWYNNRGWAMNTNSIQGTISGNSFVEDRISVADIPNFSNYQNGVLFANIGNNISLTANLFKKVHIGMYLYRFSPFSGTVNATQNIFDQAFQNAVRVLPSTNYNPDLTNVSVNYNAFLAGSIIEATGQAMTLNATCNWFDSPSGNVIATKVLGNVNYTPWLTDGTDASPSIGFQPAGACNGSNNAPVITCVTNQNRTNNSNSCNYTATGNEFDLTSVSVTCGSATLSYSLSGATTGSGNIGTLNNVVFNLGVTTVTWTATDLCGNTSNCSFTVTVTQNPATTVVYTILAQEEIHTHRNYVYGNIGVWQAGKDVRIHEYSTISGFVQAPVIEKDNTSVIFGAQTLAMAPMPTASSFLYNTQPDPNIDITVPDNYAGTFNLLGNNFRKITIGKNVTARFMSSGNIYIRELIIKDADVNKTTNLLFSGNSVLLIRRTLDIGKRNNINQAGGYTVTMYVQENDVKVGASSKVNASIDVRFKNLLPQDALETNHTIFTGQYIAKKVDSKKWVDWNGLCVSGAPVPAASPAITGSSPTMDRQGNSGISGQPVMDNPVAFKVNIYPNPTRSQFTVQIAGESNTPVMIRITDMAGRVQLVKTVNSNCVVTFGSSLTVGAYIAEVTQDNTRQLFKLIKAE